MGANQLCLVFLAFLAVSHGFQWPWSKKVPTQKLKSGGNIPMLGIGTYLMDNQTEAEAALDLALSLGFRHIDTATNYNTEKYVGNVIRKWLDAGKVKREELFITTKLQMGSMRAEDVAEELQKSLENLQIDYVDMWLMHMPWGFVKGAGLGSLNAIDKTTNHTAIWQAMEEEFFAGRTKGLGVANFNETQIDNIGKFARVPISDLQVENQLEFQQKELLAFAKKRGIRMTAYSPLGEPSYAGVPALSKWRVRQLPRLFNIPIVREIAARHKKSPAQILLRYNHQRGVIVIPKAVTPSHIRENINIFDFNLCRKEMDQLAAVDRGMLEGKIWDLLGIGGVVDHPHYPWPAFLNLSAPAALLC